MNCNIGWFENVIVIPKESLYWGRMLLAVHPAFLHNWQSPVKIKCYSVLLLYLCYIKEIFENFAVSCKSGNVSFRLLAGFKLQNGF